VRRPAGVSEEALAAQLQPGLAAFVSTRPAAERQAMIHISNVNGTPLGHQVTILLPYVLAASVLLTLVIACANVAILMIAQWTAREHEIAIRASLGASRGRIVRALVTESLLLAAMGGALGICATFALRGIIVHRSGAGNFLAFYDLSIDPRILVESILITLASGIVAGLAPALYETRRLHANPLNALASSDETRQRLRHALVVLEITVTIALLVETGAMIGGYQRSLSAEMGFDGHPLFVARVDNAGGLQAAQTLDLVARVPGVASAAAATGMPYMGGGTKERVSADAAGAGDLPVDQIAVSPGFFATLGVPIESGRDFTPRDTTASHVAIVNGALARQLFPGRAPLGSRVVAGGTAYDIVGVASDFATNQFQQRQSAPKMFVPLALDGAPVKRMQLLVRAAGDPAPLLQTVRRELRNAAAGNTIPSSFTFDQIARTSAEEILVGTAPLVPLIAIGMLLTTAGIYGVLAFAIVRRSRELAVRVAIGATGRDLIRLVTAHSLRLLLAGTACGVGLTFVLSRLARAGGGDGSIYDPDWPAFAVPVVIVFVIGALATLMPSRRATKIDPAVLLRTT
jgi:predicted permease